MPIHLRAERGDYAPAVLCPGDPRRARYIAETFFDQGARLVNEERGMLGYTGTFEGAPISVQSAGMAGYAPSATFALAETAARLSRESGTATHVGPIVTSPLFYDPDAGNVARWRRLGHLGIEMEAAMLYAVAAVRGVEALAMMTVSDLISDSASERISDAELKRGVDEMTRLACRVAVS